MRGSIRIGSIAGIEISLHPTWFIIFVLITISMVTQFAGKFPGQSNVSHWLAGLLSSVLFFCSVLFHEMSHSLLATKMGYPVRGITLFVFGGISLMEKEPEAPSSEFWISIVGPLSSFLLSGIFLVISRLMPGSLQQMAEVFTTLSAINLALGLFNLVPAFPLDGGRVLRSALWKAKGNLRNATRTAGRFGQFFGYFLIVSGLLISFSSGDLFRGLWLVFIGWFLNNAAESSVMQVELQHALQGLTAKDIMTPEFPSVAGDMSLFDLVEDYILPTGTRCFLVTRDDRLEGIISLHEIKAVDRGHWKDTKVRDVMKPGAKLAVADREMELQKILQLMDERNVNQLPVIDHQRLTGLITRERVLNLIRARMALEGKS